MRDRKSGKEIVLYGQQCYRKRGVKKRSIDGYLKDSLPVLRFIEQIAVKLSWTIGPKSNNSGKVTLEDSNFRVEVIKIATHFFPNMVIEKINNFNHQSQR